MKKPRIIVEVTDGAVYVYCDRPEDIDLIVLDYDTDGVAAAELCEIDGQSVSIKVDGADGFSNGTELYWTEAHEQKPYKEETAAVWAQIASALERLAMRINNGPHADTCEHEADCPCWERGYAADRGQYR